MHNISIENLQKLALEIVELYKKEPTDLLMEKVRELYEKTLILHYLNYNRSSSFIEKKEKNSIVEIEEKLTDLTDDVEKNVSKKIENVRVDLNKVEDVLKSGEFTEPTKTILPKIFQDEEMTTSITREAAAQLFDKKNATEPHKKSLNDLLSQKQIIIGLNDRIAFVKHLFNDNLVDFNRVVSQLNTFDNEIEAKQFFVNIVKSDYDWTGKEEYELRFLQLIERKFI